MAVGGKRLAPRRTREEQETAMEIASPEFPEYFQCSYLIGLVILSLGLCDRATIDWAITHSSGGPNSHGQLCFGDHSFIHVLVPIAMAAAVPPPQ